MSEDLDYDNFDDDMLSYSERDSNCTEPYYNPPIQAFFKDANGNTIHSFADSAAVEKDLVWISSPGPYHHTQLEDHQLYPEIPDEWDSPDDDDSEHSDDFRGEPYLCSPSSSAYEVSTYELSASASASTSPPPDSAPNPDYLPDEVGAVALTGMAATELGGRASSDTFRPVQTEYGDVDADALDLELDDYDHDHDYHPPLSTIDMAEEDPDLYDHGAYGRVGAGVSVGADASDDYDGYESPGDVFDDYDGVDDYDGDVFGDYDDDF